MPAPSPLTHMERDGFAILPPTVSALELDALAAAAEPLLEQRAGERYGGARDVLRALPPAAELARSTAVRRWVEPILGPDCFAVRGLLFDKSPASNWKVPYHQDLAIAVRRRRDAAGFGPWSLKAGIPHVQSPVRLLEGMLAVRVHLDECGSDNGPLRVLPRSHKAGILSAAEIDFWRQSVREVSCPVQRGGLLLMRPLLLHASSAAAHVHRRRVIHLEYAATPLPEGLEWNDAIRPDEVAG